MAHRASETSSASVRRGIGDGMQAQEIRSNTGNPRQRWLARATPAAREGRAGRLGMTDRPVVLEKPGNAGGGKGP